MLKLGVIGVGNMAAALLGGILKNGVVPPEQILLCDRHPERHEALYSLGIRQAANPCEVVESCKYVLLAVKPQGFTGVLEEIKPACKGQNIFISIAAGISGDFIKKALDYDAKVVLVMPNTPVLLGYGTSALSLVSPTNQDEFNTVLSFFAACGDAIQIPSNLMNEVIPFNGSSPAFIYRFTQIFVQRAVALGFDQETALKLFCSTLIGSAHMMIDSGIDLDQLIKMVCSKGGTTLAGLDAMEQHNLEEAVVAGIDNCVKRAYELGR
ncbi:pyrroline-5-carboxylate reductase [Oscillospiraceae bacterium LTW-04]|nr:pyrroline-5-carboxylate reductase [Oscillospiraceae bacterium MB24-C1]